MHSLQTGKILKQRDSLCRDPFRSRQIFGRVTWMFHLSCAQCCKHSRAKLQCSVLLTQIPPLIAANHTLDSTWQCNSSVNMQMGFTETRSQQRNFVPKAFKAGYYIVQTLLFQFAPTTHQLIPMEKFSNCVNVRIFCQWGWRLGLWQNNN